MEHVGLSLQPLEEKQKGPEGRIINRSLSAEGEEDEGKVSRESLYEGCWDDKYVKEWQLSASIWGE